VRFRACGGQWYVAGAPEAIAGSAGSAVGGGEGVGQWASLGGGCFVDATLDAPSPAQLDLFTEGVGQSFCRERVSDAVAAQVQIAVELDQRLAAVFAEEIDANGSEAATGESLGAGFDMGERGRVGFGWPTAMGVDPPGPEAITDRERFVNDGAAFLHEGVSSAAELGELSVRGFVAGGEFDPVFGAKVLADRNDVVRGDDRHRLVVLGLCA
jgi:hypothetical protein